MVSLAMRYSISYKQDAEEIERVWRLEEAKSYSIDVLLHLRMRRRATNLKSLMMMG